MSDTTDNVGARKETTSRSSTPGRSQVPSTDSTENDPSTPISSAPAESENLQPSQPTQPTQPNLTLAQTLASILTAAGMSVSPPHARSIKLPADARRPEPLHSSIFGADILLPVPTRQPPSLAPVTVRDCPPSCSPSLSSPARITDASRACQSFAGDD